MPLTLTDVSALTEQEARDTFERIRWPNGPVCHRCGSVEVTKLEGDAHRVGLYKCRGCEEQFSSTTGTILEQSHLPIRTWLMAFAIICSAKKGVSALQLQRQLGLGSYRTAWHLCHRIRHAMSQEPLSWLLGGGGGTVEVDETYVGGKPRPEHGQRRMGAKRGRGTKKTPVLALVERGGRARVTPIKRVDAQTLKAAIREQVDPSARIVTDELASYSGIGSEFRGGHFTVSHSSGEYARGDVHTNEVEGYFALLKRGVMGSFHHVSTKHLWRYCDEFSFRWDRRDLTDGARTAEAIRAGEGKRLRYKTPIGN